MREEDREQRKNEWDGDFLLMPQRHHGKLGRLHLAESMSRSCRYLGTKENCTLWTLNMSMLNGAVRLKVN